RASTRRRRLTFAGALTRTSSGIGGEGSRLVGEVGMRELVLHRLFAVRYRGPPEPQSPHVVDADEGHRDEAPDVEPDGEGNRVLPRNAPQGEPLPRSGLEGPEEPG